MDLPRVTVLLKHESGLVLQHLDLQLLALAQPRHVGVEEDQGLETGELRPVQPQPGHSVQGVGEELHLGEGHRVGAERHQALAVQKT